MLLTAFAIVAALLLAPGEAWAWGPITHLTHGVDALASLSIGTAMLQRMLRRHRLEYLYGCVGADITQAKKYTRAQQAHCHSWEVGWAMLDRARSDPQRAFAWGYLTHLAGDVYSHNHYVPTQMIVSFRGRALRHVYWEARFDIMQPKPPRDVIRELREHDFPECDRLVEEVVARTLFSFRMDKRIFNSFIAVHDLDQWHRIVARVTERSRFSLPVELVRQYNTACGSSVLDLFRRHRDSACQQADPTGYHALEQAKKVRATLRALLRADRVTPGLEKRIRELDEQRDLSLPCCEPLTAEEG
jgi:hypothetical protein